MWTDDHITAEFPIHGITFDSMRAKPQPLGHVPIGIGGHGPAALRSRRSRRRLARRVPRSCRHCRARQDAPGRAAQRLLRHLDALSWDALEDDHDTVLDELDLYREIGVNHCVPEPRQRTMDRYLELVEGIASLLVRGGVEIRP